MIELACNAKWRRRKENLAQKTISPTARLLPWRIPVTRGKPGRGHKGPAIWRSRADIAKEQLYLKRELHCGKAFSGMRLRQSRQLSMQWSLRKTGRSGLAPPLP